jgi:hypothetical protein
MGINSVMKPTLLSKYEVLPGDSHAGDDIQNRALNESCPPNIVNRSFNDFQYFAG